jgi:hypothetical protein
VEISVTNPAFVTVRASEEDEFFGAAAVEMLIPADFPDKALAAVAFLRESEFDSLIKAYAFETVFTGEDGESELAEYCEAIIQECGNIWVYFDDEGESKCYLGTAQKFSERVQQALAEAQPSAAPKMGV